MPTRHFNFADLFELAADTVPDRLALVDARREVTYRELDERPAFGDLVGGELEEVGEVVVTGGRGVGHHDRK